MTLGEILAGRGIADPAGGVGGIQREPAALPFTAQPDLERLGPALGVGQQDLADVLDADLGDDGKAANGIAVAVARDVPDALIPDMRGAVAPAVLLEDRMDLGPAEFGAPEPECGLGQGARGPSGDMRFVPVAQAFRGQRFARELAYSEEIVYR